MKKKLLFLLVVPLILVSLLSGPAFTQGMDVRVKTAQQNAIEHEVESVNHYIINNNSTHHSSGNSTEIIQSVSDYQFPNKLSAGVRKYAKISQQGTENEAIIVQTGSWTSEEQSMAYIYQDGKGNISNINQDGKDNKAEIEQKGKDNKAYITQDGVGNIAIIRQLSTNNRFFRVTQISNNDEIKIIQN